MVQRIGMLEGNETVIARLFGKIVSLNSKRKEALLCNKIALYLRNKCLDGAKMVWFHVPNESNGGKRFGRTLNALGRIAGAPDYVLITEKQTCMIEVKTDKGRLSASQKAFSLWCDDCGVSYFTVRDMQQLKDLVKNLL